MAKLALSWVASRAHDKPLNNVSNIGTWQNKATKGTSGTDGARKDGDSGVGAALLCV